MPPAKGTSRNRELVRGINAIPKGRMFKKTGRYHFTKKTHPKQEKKTTAIRSRFYPADDEPKPLNRNFTPKAAKLRNSISPGSVLIVLAGRFRGCRVVFLKQLDSGLLLVTGPFKLNGCPLRRINQAYVISTSTKVDLKGVQVPKDVNDALFNPPKKRHEKQSEEQFFLNQVGEKPKIDDKRKKLQDDVDSKLLGNLDDMTKSYLASVFTLRKNDKPHEMNF